MGNSAATPNQWLIDELRTRYDIPTFIATQWINGNEILPLLDGLDEVAKEHRSGCVQAINAFHNKQGLVRFVVCSRIKDYKALASLLQVEEAVELQPPTRQQVYDYLKATGAALANVQAAVEADETL
jgi:eukaryotic-like serine/threonine-protein kinase